MVGTYCCVPNCYNSSVKCPNLSFHLFPNDNKLRNKWINAINRQGEKGKFSKFIPLPSQKVCGKHFKSGKKTYMDKIPSIFPSKKVTITTLRTTKNSKNATSTMVSTNTDSSMDVLVPTVENDVNATTSDSSFTEFDEQPEPTHIDAMRDGARTRDVGTQTGTDDLQGIHETLHEENMRSVTEKLQNMEELLRKANEKIMHLEMIIANATTKIDVQRGLLLKKSFGIEAAKESPKMLKFYTGFSNYSSFRALFSLVEECIPYLNYIGSATTNQGERAKRGRQRMLTAEDELFLVLSRLRVGLLINDLAFRYDVSESTISRICCTWFDLLDNRLSQIPKWLSNKAIAEEMPVCFKENYPNTRVILDCTEIYFEKPSAFREQSETFSQYKHHNTAKGLIGISPSGYITFISKLSPGHVSDKLITIESGIVDLLEEGDGVMADRGFFIDDILAAKKVTLNIPPFLRGLPQLSAADEQETRKIASLRIHVERVIERVKRYRILKFVCPITISPDLNKIWRICCNLVNFTSSRMVE